MELHAIWNRIDQLEQLIISQAKEIDSLRRMVNTTQVTVQSCRLNNDINSHYMRANGHIKTASPNHLLCPAIEGASNAKGQTPTNRKSMFVPTNQHHMNHQHQHNQCQPLYKSYVMNPIHPAIAIPPVTSRVVLRSAEQDTTSATATQAQLNKYLHRGGSEEPSYRPAITNSRTLPANTRWSTGPSLLGTLNDPSDTDRENDERALRTKNRFNLIEVLTCFCPCFGMC